MTVSSTTNRNNYTGDGSVDTYSYTFKIFSNTDLRVTVRNTNNVETTLTLTTDYTVTGVGSASGGTVVLVNSSQAWLDGDGDLLTGYEISIRRVRPITQLTDIRNQGSFLPETHEDEFDKGIMIAQQQQDEIDRSISLPESVDPDDFDNKLPATIVGSGGVFLKTNSSGDGFTFSEGNSTDLSVPAGNGILAKTGSGSSEARTLTGTSNQITITNGDGISGDPTFAIANNAIFPGTEGVQVPQGTTAQRAGTPTNGEIRYNSTVGKIEAYQNAIWSNLLTSASLTIGRTYNLGIDLSAGTLSIVSASGSALSATNFGYVVCPSNTGGLPAVIKVSGTDHFFVDDSGASDIVGEQFGVTSGVAWGSDRPFFLYFCNSDDTEAGGEFFISPAPNLTQSPATANIGYHANPMGTPSDHGAFFLTSTDVTSSHAQKPCVRVGGIRMQMSASDDWTVSALDETNGDGLRDDPFHGQIFNFPTGQMGAVSGSHLTSDAGSPAPPTWAGTVIYNYGVNLNGVIDVVYNTGEAGNCTNGTAANGIMMALPYDYLRPSGSSSLFRTSFVGYINNGVSNAAVFLTFNSSDVNTPDFTNDLLQDVDEDDFNDTGSDIMVTFSYRAFGVSP